MMRRILVVVLIVVGGVGWWLTYHSDHLADEDVKVDVYAPHENAAYTAPDVVSSEEKRVALVVTNGEGGSEHVAVVASREEEGVRVHVVDEAGVDVVGVPVALYTEAQAMQALARSVTDDAGIARLKNVVDMARTAADASTPQGLFITTDVPLPDAPRVDLVGIPAHDAVFTLVLPEHLAGWHQPLGVRVIDTAGEPVFGARVALVVKSPALAQASYLGQASEIEYEEKHTAAPDGVAALPLTEFWGFWRMGRAMQVTATATVHVRCLGPFDELVEVPVDLTRPPPALIDIALPPMGALDITFDQLPHWPLSVMWRRADRPDDEWNRMHLSADEVDAQSTRIGPLGLGWTLEIEARLRSTRHSVQTQASGPINDGQVVTVPLTFSAPVERFELRGSVVDGDNKPRTNVAALFNVINDSEDLVAQASTRTDDEGRFDVGILMTPEEAEQLRNEHLVLEWRNMHNIEADITRLDMSKAAWDEHVVELGEQVASRPPPPPASPPPPPEDVVEPWELTGSVSDADGMPIAGATVSLEGGHRKKTRATSNAQGVFRLSFDKARADECSLHVTADDYSVYYTRQLTVTHVDVVLARVGVVRGRVRLDPDIPLMDLQAVVMQNGTRRQSNSIFTVGSGHFEMSRVPLGNASVQIELVSRKWTLQRVDDVVVTPGFVVDPRLDEFDLRGLLRWLKLEVRVNGAAAPDVEVAVRAGDFLADDLEVDRAGRIDLVVPSSFDTFDVGARGCNIAGITWQPGVVRVDLVTQ